MSRSVNPPALRNRLLIPRSTNINVTPTEAYKITTVRQVPRTDLVDDTKIFDVEGPPRLAPRQPPPGTVAVACATGAITAGPTVFTVEGTSPDVNFVRVQMSYVPTNNPPSRLRCSTDSGSTFVDC